MPNSEEIPSPPTPSVVGSGDAREKGVLNRIGRRLGIVTEHPTIPVTPASPPDQELDIAILADAIGEPILVVDPRRRIILANPAARQLLGNHVIGQDVRLLLRHPGASSVIAAGSDAVVELTGLAQPDDAWELRVTVVGDNRLLRLVDRNALRAMERVRTDFVANASHELRTPLATLSGFVETLDGPAGDDPAVRQRFLGIMRREAERMTRLVDDLMSLSRIEADKHRAPAGAVDLAALVAEVVKITRDRLGTKPRDIQVDLVPDLPKVAGEREQLLQLLYNLIGNAVKYGAADRPIRISLAPVGSDLVKLRVADEGEGIAPEHLPRLTERFYRVDAGRSRAVGGTGLGLAIVKHIVERHRGRLQIDSELGVGTTVSVLLPQSRRGSVS